MRVQSGQSGFSHCPSDLKVVTTTQVSQECPLLPGSLHIPAPLPSLSRIPQSKHQGDEGMRALRQGCQAFLCPAGTNSGVPFAGAPFSPHFLCASRDTGRTKMPTTGPLPALALLPAALFQARPPRMMTSPIPRRAWRLERHRQK